MVRWQRKAAVEACTGSQKFAVDTAAQDNRLHAMMQLFNLFGSLAWIMSSDRLNTLEKGSKLHWERSSGNGSVRRTLLWHKRAAVHLSS